MNHDALSLAVTAAAGAGIMSIPRPSWRSALQYAAGVAENTHAINDTPQAQLGFTKDIDYYEAGDNGGEQSAVLRTLGNQLVPAHLVFAAFGAGYAARGHASLARRILAAVAEAALHPARAVRGRRRQDAIRTASDDEDDEDQDFVALLSELDAGGPAARKAAAKRLGITEADLCQRAKARKPPRQKSDKQPK